MFLLGQIFFVLLHPQFRGQLQEEFLPLICIIVLTKKQKNLSRGEGGEDEKRKKGGREMKGRIQKIIIVSEKTKIQGK